MTQPVGIPADVIKAPGWAETVPTEGGMLSSVSERSRSKAEGQLGDEAGSVESECLRLQKACLSTRG